VESASVESASVESASVESASVESEPFDDDEPFDEEAIAAAEEAQEPMEVDPGFELETAENFADLEAGRATVHGGLNKRRGFETRVKALAETGDEGRRRGLGLWVLGDYEGCVDALAGYESDDTAAYTRARALFSLHNYGQAAEIFERLSHKYPQHPSPRAGAIEAKLEAKLAGGADEEALANEYEAEVNGTVDFSETPQGSYLLGRICELRRDWETALDHYLAGHEADNANYPLLRRFAHLAERCGLDDLAMSLYRELVDAHQADRTVMMNLGVLYEDHGRDSDAAACYDVVFRNSATDERARLYLADARAAINSYYDEDLEKKEDRLNQILRIPITDFELSVRARNCLNKMLITTLGDLVQKTEQELLSYKNFGETSLTEIKEILHSKGLRLGMPREEAVASIEAHAFRTTSSDHQDMLNRPLLDLQLSIRSRRTVETLGCLTLGDVVKHSAEELLGMPNFGQTSLLELRSKLSEIGMKLKGD
ncbi:MAG: hypothetical protein CMJ89_12740, partial [Planctomycetes bacterium]|nr:hypothetical protein [Planctomycetota bacterium]